jgi:hypothetical protein
MANPFDLRAQVAEIEAKQRAQQGQFAAPPQLHTLQGKIDQTFQNAQPGPRLQMERPGANPYFAAQRNAMAGRFAGAAQQGQGAIDRRFAANGMGGSGSAIKATMMNQAQADQGREEAMLGIAGQEQQANEALVGRNFQREGTNFQQELSESPIGRLMAQLQAQGQLSGVDQGYKQLLADYLANKENARLGQQQLEKTGGLFGGGGFMGLGF